MGNTRRVPDECNTGELLCFEGGKNDVGGVVHILVEAAVFILGRG